MIGCLAYAGLFLFASVVADLLRRPGSFRGRPWRS